MTRRRVLQLMLCFLAIVLPVLYVNSNKAIYAARVHSYLIEEKGYEQAELEQVKGHFGIKLPRFYVTVIFRDERNVTYVYYAHRGVMQAEAIRDGKAVNEALSTLKHWGE